MRLKKYVPADLKIKLPEDVVQALADFGVSSEIATEFAIEFRRIGRRGYISFNTRRLDDAFGSVDRKKLKKMLNTSGLFKLTREACKDSNSRQYQYLGDWSEADEFSEDECKLDCAPTDISLKDAPTERPTMKTFVVLAHRFYDRYLQWVEYVSRDPDLSLCFDVGRDGPVGDAVRDGLEALRVDHVTESNIDDPDLTWSQRESHRNTLRRMKDGVRHLVRRIRGRCYHPLTSCPKTIRRHLKMFFKGRTERAVCVDMSATYLTLLVSSLNKPEQEYEQLRLINLIQEGQFYGSVNELLPEEKRYKDPGELKKEFQRQCIFWRDGRISRRPIWEAFRVKFPMLCGLIQEKHDKLGVTRLSDWLMRKESSIFVEKAMVGINRAGIPVVPIHDALMVPESVAEWVHGVLVQIAVDALGFTPRFKIERAPSMVAACA